MSANYHPEEYRVTEASGPSLAFAPLGVSGPQERVYRALIELPGSTAATAAGRAGLSAGETRRALAALEANGLVSRLPGKPVGYLPTSPDVAVETLITRRQEELASARLAAQRLVRDYQDHMRSTQPAELIEVVAGRAAFAQRYLQMKEHAVFEVVELDRPPYVTSLEACNAADAAALRGGVRSRAVYDRAGLSVNGRFDRIRAAAKLGEQSRVMDGVPVKLTIVDHRLALIPLQLEHPGREEGLLIHPSALLDALCLFFETLWQRAAPLRFGRKGEGRTDDAPELSEDDSRVLELLAAGFKDQAIAHQLGIGFSTVERRIKRLMMTVGAQTRVQLGLRLSERGWLKPAAE